MEMNLSKAWNMEQPTTYRGEKMKDLQLAFQNALMDR